MMAAQGGLPPVHPFTGMDVSSVLESHAKRFGSKRFLAWEPRKDGQPAAWTYQEFADEVERTAAGLATRGVREGDRVMLLLENSPAFVFCWFACARLGAVAIDANIHYTRDELAHAISLTDPVGVVTLDERLSELEGLLDDMWTTTIDTISGTCPGLRGDVGNLPTRRPDPGAPLCVQFTSGTTSRPKAVLYTHANALWGARVGASHGSVTSDDTFLVSMPLFHTAALMWHFLPTWWVGGTVVLVPGYSASQFWDISRRHSCTQTMLLGISKKTLDAQPVPEHSFRVWQFALEFPSLERRYGVRVLGCWGMTEVVTNVIVGNLHHPCETGAIGWASPEYDVRIIDEAGDDVPPGVPGELLVRGVRGLSVFAEYLSDPEATAAAFDDDGYFRTGDCVRLTQSGAIEYVTRLKDMLKVGGENVAAAEIERVCLTVTGVTEAAVVGRRDDLLDEVPVAFVVAHGAAEERIIEEVMRACSSALARFKVPREVHVVDELPERLLGKVAKADLRALAEALANGGGSPVNGSSLAP